MKNTYAYFIPERRKPELTHSTNTSSLTQGKMEEGRTPSVRLEERQHPCINVFCVVDIGAGQRRTKALSYLGRALHCSDGKVMPSRVWQKTCLCCTARRGPMQGPLHWEGKRRCATYYLCPKRTLQSVALPQTYTKYICVSQRAGSLGRVFRPADLLCLLWIKQQTFSGMCSVPQWDS